MLAGTFAAPVEMLRLIIVALAVVIALMGLRVVPLLPGFGLIIVVLLAGTALDQRIAPRRSTGSPPRGLDTNRGQLYGQASTWDTPQAYIDHPDGAGTPAGVETQSRVAGVPAGSILGPDGSERR
jgi:hypothetical protein